MLPDFMMNPIIKSDMENIYNFSAGLEQLKDSSFYVTGSSGMLASYLVYFLIYLNEKHNYGIKIFANVRNKLKAAERFGIYTDKSYFTLVNEDVNNKISLNERTDYIIHAASPASPQFYGSNPVEVILPNTVGTYNLLEYAKNFGVKSFLFFSSGSVYGSLNKSALEGDSGTMNFLDSGNSYGEAKRCGEALCRAYFTEYGVPVKSVRIYHSYGPTMDLINDRRAFSEFVNNVINNEDIILTSDGSARRGFCYITDSVRAFLTVLLHGVSGESYNLGNMKEWFSMREIAEILVNLYPEKKLKLVFAARKDKGYKLSPEKTDYPADVSKIMSLGWKPEISASEGFKRVIESKKFINNQS